MKHKNREILYLIGMNLYPFKHSISELNHLEPERGRLLIAEPFMEDPYFKRSVVLLAQHDQEEGSVGFIINHLLDLNIGEVLPEFKDFEAKVYLGGPVEAQNLFYLHRIPDMLPGAKHITRDLYWDGDFDVLKQLIKKQKIKASDIQFILGYSGWGKNQLTEEIKQNSWIIESLKKQKILNNEGLSLWNSILKEAKQEIAVMANFPEDPSLN